MSKKVSPKKTKSVPAKKSVKAAPVKKAPASAPKSAVKAKPASKSGKPAIKAAPKAAKAAKSAKPAKPVKPAQKAVSGQSPARGAKKTAKKVAKKAGKVAAGKAAKKVAKKVAQKTSAKKVAAKKVVQKAAVAAKKPAVKKAPVRPADWFTAKPALDAIYRNPKMPLEQRVEDLLSRMTIEEKTDQIMQTFTGGSDNPNNVGNSNYRPTIGSILGFWHGAKARNEFQRQALENTRLGIPIIWGMDVIHGQRTMFPIPLAQACSFNPEITRIGCEVAALESAPEGTNWTFAPMVDICRDPRWGRVAEGFGEDPYVGSRFAEAAVRGFQGGDHFVPGKSMAACLKHFCGYGYCEGGKDYCYSDISRQTLWETILPPFHAGVKAGAMTLMSSFNDITGTPAVANHYTQTEVLRNRWGFDGFVVSDWASITQLGNQGFSADPAVQTIATLSAGNDMEMADASFLTIPELVKNGRLSLAVVDEAVRRVLRIKFRIGLFEQPYASEAPVSEYTLLPEYIQKAEAAAAETFVLLKNDGGVLPLAKEVKKIALLGPVAADRGCMKGMWGGMGKEEHMTTIEMGMREKLPAGCELLYAKGCDFETDDRSGFADALAAAQAADAVVVCLGEPVNATGEDCSRANIRLHGVQEELLREVGKLGKPLTLVISSGRPMDLYTTVPLAQAILYIWQPGHRGGAAVADMLLGNLSPSGRLAITFPLTTGHIPTFYGQRQFARDNKQGYYKDMGVEPLFPFGHGLSYTTVEYSPVTLSAPRLKQAGKLTATVTVKNTGSRSCKETVFWYITDVEATITQPKKKLIGFEKVELLAGESKTISIKIDPARDLSYVNCEGKAILEPGKFLLRTTAGEAVEFVLE